MTIAESALGLLLVGAVAAVLWARGKGPGADLSRVSLSDAPRPSWTPPTKAQPYMAAFREAERRYGLPPNILVRMAQQESNFDPNAVSPAGAVGLMQIVPKWHPTVDPRDPFASIDYAGRYLRQLYDRFGNWPEALAAYNWGPTVLERKGLDQAPRETRRYVAAIAGDLGLA